MRYVTGGKRGKKISGKFRASRKIGNDGFHFDFCRIKELKAAEMQSTFRA